MSGLLQLRTYTLKTAQSAKTYAPLWARHKTSLQKYNVQTIGVFTSHTDPRKIIAIVQFPPSNDPDAIMRAYTTSEQFKKDLDGFDKSLFESVESVVLERVDE